MRCAIYTSIEAFGPILEDTPLWQKIIALSSLQELSDFPCDIGSKLEDLQPGVEGNYR